MDDAFANLINPIDALTCFQGSRRTLRNTAGTFPQRLGFNSATVSDVVRGAFNVEISNSYD